MFEAKGCENFEHWKASLYRPNVATMGEGIRLEAIAAEPRRRSRAFPPALHGVP